MLTRLSLECHFPALSGLCKERVAQLFYLGNWNRECLRLLRFPCCSLCRGRSERGEDALRKSVAVQECELGTVLKTPPVCLLVLNGFVNQPCVLPTVGMRLGQALSSNTTDLIAEGSRVMPSLLSVPPSFSFLSLFFLPPSLRPFISPS